jgi:hypothetical protein
VTGRSDNSAHVVDDHGAELEAEVYSCICKVACTQFKMYFQSLAIISSPGFREGAFQIMRWSRDECCGWREVNACDFAGDFKSGVGRGLSLAGGWCCGLLDWRRIDGAA